MNESLIIRISNQQSISAIWWTWSFTENKVLDQGSFDIDDELDTLYEMSQNRSVYVLLSGADINLQEVELPVAKMRHLDKALPFLLEDKVAEEIENIHVAQLFKQGSKVYAAVLDKAWFLHIIERFKAWNITVSKVVPEVLALPDDSNIHCLKLNDEWLIRQGLWQGVTIPQGWLSYYHDAFNSNNTDKKQDVVYHSQVDMENVADSDISLQISEPYELLSKGVIAQNCTLLTGEFKPKSAKGKYWPIWKKCAYAAIFTVVIWGGQVTYQTVKLNQEANALHQESERIFRQIFPQKQRIPTVSYLKRQFSSELAVLSGGAQGQSVLGLFEKFAVALGEKKNIDLQNMSYDASRAEIKIDLKGTDFNAFEDARLSLESSFAVQQGPLNRSNDQVFGSYILTEK
ncbi:type II secretion system protein GspL [Vibrio viridaestus]|uniref:Type II secretion system protein L n=1 Tax=Vibrio viridaestus TaxID=2487322 RepID=A0A3N9TB47_9VIBR|nr:type II secretion system protein GspL [Vibrio viridaestus]RQW61388.1 type II secretion system protein GspL [Vibrio viridaestus]